MEARLASSADAPRLTELHGESFGNAKWTVRQMCDGLNASANRCWLAIDNGKVIGFLMTQFVAGEAEILTFCIAPDARRKGAGRFLLSALIAVTKNENLQKIFLEVAVDNEAALALYQKTGFKITGTRKAYYRQNGTNTDAALLELVL